MDAPGSKLDDEQDVQGLQSDRLHGEEVGGENAAGLRSQELRPGRTRSPRSRTEAGSAEDRADRRGPDPDTELRELAADPHAAPPRVLPGHPQDQLRDLRVDG